LPGAAIEDTEYALPAAFAVPLPMNPATPAGSEMAMTAAPKSRERALLWQEVHTRVGDRPIESHPVFSAPIYKLQMEA